MELTGICSICGKPASLTCQLCGRIVCEQCEKGGVCKSCMAGKR